jgi:hypothetical protein
MKFGYYENNEIRTTQRGILTLTESERDAIARMAPGGWLVDGLEIQITTHTTVDPKTPHIPASDMGLRGSKP